MHVHEISTRYVNQVGTGEPVVNYLYIIAGVIKSYDLIPSLNK